MRESRVIKKLKQNKPVLVGSPTPYPSAKICELIGKAGYDCIWIDHEHQDFSDPDIWHMCLAARATDMDAMVRVRKGPYYSYFRALESGANGIMVPHCMDAEEARWIVRNTKFAPVGLRGMNGIEAHADHSLQPMDEYMEQANSETFVAVQIEDKEALDKVDEIAAVEGIDILFVGPGDLSQSLGIPLDFGNRQVDEVVKKVAAAARHYGKHWGMPAGSAEQAKALLTRGAQFIAWGSAIRTLAEGFKKRKTDFDRIVASIRR